MQLSTVWISFLLVFICGASSADGTLKTEPWPSEPTSEKVELQFLELKFNLPCAMLKHLALLQSDTPQLLISSSSSDMPTEYISIQTLHGFKNEIYPTLQKQGLLQSAGIDSAESFFGTLALPVTTKDQAVRQAVLGTEESADYFKTSKGPLTAYRNISEQVRLQSIIILLDGSDTVYEITGSITNRDYEYILSGLTPSE